MSVSAQKKNEKPAAKQVLEPVLVAVDDGNAQYKLVLQDGTRITIDSHIERGRPRVADASGGDDNRLSVYMTTDGHYTVGNVEMPMERNNDFGFSPASQVLLQHILRMAGLNGRSVFLCTGLPLRSFYLSDGSINTARVAQKSATAQASPSVLLKNGRLFGDEGLSDEEAAARAKAGVTHIAGSLVQAEGVVAYFNLYLRETAGGLLEVNPEYAGKNVAILDPGGKTTEVAVMNGFKVKMDRSSTIQYGMNLLYRRARDYLSDLGFEQISEDACRTLIRDGYVLDRGTKVDHSTFREESLNWLAMSIFDELVNRIGDGRDLYKLYVIGGTAAALKDRLLPLLEKKYVPGFALFDEDPQSANANGMLRSIRFMIQERQAKAKKLSAEAKG